MMMERAKTAPASEQSTPPKSDETPLQVSSQPPTSQERVDELERRLNVLDSTLGVEESTESGFLNNGVAPSVSVFHDTETVGDKSNGKVQTSKEESHEQVNLSAVEKQTPNEMKTSVEKTKPAAPGTGKNNPLLVRVCEFIVYSILFLQNTWSNGASIITFAPFSFISYT